MAVLGFHTDDPALARCSVKELMSVRDVEIEIALKNLGGVACHPIIRKNVCYYMKIHAFSGGEILEPKRTLVAGGICSRQRNSPAI